MWLLFFLFWFSDWCHIGFDRRTHSSFVIIDVHQQISHVWKIPYLLSFEKRCSKNSWTLKRSQPLSSALFPHTASLVSHDCWVTVSAPEVSLQWTPMGDEELTQRKEEGSNVSKVAQSKISSFGIWELKQRWNGENINEQLCPAVTAPLHTENVILHISHNLPSYTNAVSLHFVLSLLRMHTLLS